MKKQLLATCVVFGSIAFVNAQNEYQVTDYVKVDNEIPSYYPDHLNIEKELLPPSESFEKSEAVTADPIEKQKLLLKQYSHLKGIESVVALETLTNNSLAVSSDSLSSFQHDPRITFLKLNVFDGSNLPNLLSQAINYILSGKIQGLLSEIKRNENLLYQLKTLADDLATLSTFNQTDFDNRQYSDAYSKVSSSLSEVMTTIQLDSSFSKDHYFVEFLGQAKKFLDLIFVRYNTEKMLSAIRSFLEGIQGVTASSSASLTINVPVPVPGLSVNLDAFANSESSGSSGLSFYTITKSKGAKAGVTFNILPAKISGKIGLENASIDLYYSLEGYMDYLNSSSASKLSKFQASNMRTAAKDRKGMQEKEKECLAYSGRFERSLKLFQAIPHAVSIVWVEVTKATSTDHAKETSSAGELSANVSLPALASVGITLKASKGLKKYKKITPLLLMVNNDFTPAEGFELGEIIRVAGEENDLSRTVPDSNLLLGNLNAYIFALEGLATATSPKMKKEFEDKKHSYEKVLLPKRFLGSAGREGVLRASIVTAAALRQKLPANQEQILRFRKIYDQLSKLSQLSEFSKNKHGIRKRFGYGAKASTETEVKAVVDNLQASFVAQVPYVGNVTANVTRKTVKGSPILQENGRYITLKFSLPIGSAGVVGMGILREKFKSVFAAASAKKLPINLDDFIAVSKSFGANVLGRAGGNILATVGAPISATTYGSSDFTFVWKYVDPLKYTAGTVPLPGQELIQNGEGRWVLDFVVSATSLNAGVNTTTLPMTLPLSLKASASTGKLAKRTGSDTFHDMFSKTNVLYLGMADTKASESTAINSLFNGQSGQLFKTFKGIGRMNSNSSFELQMLYNELKNAVPVGEQIKVENLFKDFITACRQLNERSASSHDEDLASGEAEVAELTESNGNEENHFNTEQFRVAFNLFKEITKMQYIHIFKPHYDRAFSITN